MKIFKEGGLYIGSSIVRRILPFILLPYLTRILTPYDFGYISLFLVAMTFSSFLLGSYMNGFSKMIYHKVPKSDYVIYIKNILCLFFSFSLVGIFILFYFRDLFLGLFQLNITFLLLSFFAAMARFIIDLQLSIFQTSREVLKYVKLELTQPLLESLFVIFLIISIHLSLESRIYSFVIPIFIISFYSIYLLYQSKLFSINFNINHIKRILKHSLPLLPHAITLTAITTVDKLILSSSVGVDFIGKFTVALSLAAPMWMLTESVNRAFAPWAYAKFKAKNYNLLVGAVHILIIILFISTIIYSIILFYTIDFIVGKSFMGSLQPALILVWVGFFKALYYFLGKALSYNEKFNFYRPVVTVISFLIYILLIYLNIEDITLNSLSIYLVIMNLLMTLGIFLITQRNHPLPWLNFSLIFKVLDNILYFYTSTKFFNKNRAKK